MESVFSTVGSVPPSDCKLLRSSELKAWPGSRVQGRIIAFFFAPGDRRLYKFLVAFFSASSTQPAVLPEQSTAKTNPMSTIELQFGTGDDIGVAASVIADKLGTAGEF